MLSFDQLSPDEQYAWLCEMNAEFWWHQRRVLALAEATVGALRDALYAYSHAGADAQTAMQAEIVELAVVVNDGKPRPPTEPTK